MIIFRLDRNINVAKVNENQIEKKSFVPFMLFYTMPPIVYNFTTNKNKVCEEEP